MSERIEDKIEGSGDIIENVNNRYQTAKGLSRDIGWPDKQGL